MTTWEEKADTDGQSNPRWLVTIRRSIEARDKREKLPFEAICVSYQSILEENVDLNARVAELHQALVKARQDAWRNKMEPNSAMADNNDSIGKSNSHHTNVDNSELTREIESLKKDLLDTLRLKKEDEVALSRLKKQAAENEALLINRREMLDTMSKQFEQLQIENREILAENTKMQSSLTVMNTENKALRSAHDQALDQVEQLRKENARLTDKILKVKEEQMEQFNQMQIEFEKIQVYQQKLALEQVSSVYYSQSPPDSAVLASHDSVSTSPVRASNAAIRSSSVSSDEKIIPAAVAAKKRTSTISERSTRNVGRSKSPKSPKSTPDGPNRLRSFTQNIFGGIFSGGLADEKKSNHDFTPNENDSFFTTKGPVVDLFGPSIFNITPPQLRSSTWLAHSEEVSCIQFDPHGKYIASAGADKFVKLWNANTGQDVCKFHGAQKTLVTCKFAPSGAFVAAGGNDCSIHLWSVRTQRQVRVYNGHNNTVTSLAFSNDSTRLISAGHDRTIRIWDSQKGNCRTQMSAHSSVNYLQISPDEYWMASAHLDGGVRFWSFRDRRELFTLKDHKPSQCNGVQFAPPEGLQVLTSSKDGRIIIWDLRKQKKLMEIQDKKYKNQCTNGKPTFSPDGQYILGGTQIAGKDGKYSLFVWRAKTGELAHTLSGHQFPITYVCWHGRGGVATADRGGNICTWV